MSPPSVLALPGFGPGPRCAADYRADSLARSRLGALPGFGPALVARATACPYERARLGWALPGFRLRPSLRVPQAGAWSTKPATGRCRVRPWPSLRALAQHHRLQEDQMALPGFGPGPRCAWLRRGQDDRWLPEGVAGVPPRPSLRVQTVVQRRSDPRWRCRGSAPALVARMSSTGQDRRALPGFGPAPCCATTSDQGCDQRTPGVAGSALVGAWRPQDHAADFGEALPGFAPALVARSLPTTSSRVATTALPGSASALVARMCTGPRLVARPAALPGFDLGPRCAEIHGKHQRRSRSSRCRAPTPALVARSRLRIRACMPSACLAGIRPGPRCAWVPEDRAE